jgi:hypothetical protein
MELKTKFWMNGALEWIARIDGEETLLGKREVPMPLEEGDKWTNELGDMFEVVNGEIRLVWKTEPPNNYW